MNLSANHFQASKRSLTRPGERDAAKILRFFLPDERGTKRSLPVLLAHGSDGAASEWVAGMSLADRLARLCPGHHRPGVVQISTSSWLEGESDTVVKLIHLLLGTHPGLRSKRMSQAKRKVLFRLAMSYPLGAGRMLRRFLEREDFRGGIGGMGCRVRLIILLENVDRLFERELLGPLESVEMKGFRDLLGFIRGIYGQQSVIFSICSHNWAKDRLLAVLNHAGIKQREGLLVHEVGIPNKAEIRSLVANSVRELDAEMALGAEDGDLNGLIEAITEDLQTYPGCRIFLSELVNRIREEADILAKSLCVLDYTGIERLSGLVSEIAERVFQQQDFDGQTDSVELLVAIRNREPQGIGLQYVAGRKKLLECAFHWRSKGILVLRLDSEGEMLFTPSHPELFSKWERGQSWLDEIVMEDEDRLPVGRSEPAIEEVSNAEKRNGMTDSMGTSVIAVMSIVTLALLLAIGFMAVVYQPTEKDEAFVLDNTPGHPAEFRSTSGKIHPIVPKE